MNTLTLLVVTLLTLLTLLTLPCNGTFARPDISACKSDTALPTTEVAATSDGPMAIVIVDVDSDTDPDMVVVSLNDGKVAWYAGDGGGGWGSENIIATFPGQEPRDAVAVDLDGDNDIDVAVTLYAGSNAVAWCANTDGLGTFSAPVVLDATAANAWNVIAVDADTDGDLDLFASYYTLPAPAVIWLENLGSGVFASPIDISAGLGSGQNGVTAMSPTDLNNDNAVDIVYLAQSRDAILWIQGDGSNGWAAPVFLSEGESDGPRDLATGDVSGDGNVDIVVASVVSDSVDLYLGDGTGSLSARRVLVDKQVNSVRTIVIADMAGDGTPDDVVFGAYISAVVGWVRNVDGAGTFGPTRVLGSVTRVQMVAVADLDGDSFLDVAATSFSGDHVDIILNRPQNIAFAPPELFSGLAGTEYLVSGDIDGDLDVDVVVSAFDSDVIVVFENNGQGGYSLPRLVVDAANGPKGIALADADGDGDLDLFATSHTFNTVSWHANDGNGNFALHTIIQTFSRPIQVRPVDLDHDGHVDIVFSSDDPAVRTIRWLRNDGAGVFTPVGNIDEDCTAWALSFADFDSDGFTDLAAACRVEDTLYWYRNTDGNGGSFARILIATLSAPRSVAVGYVNDGDDHPDVVSGGGGTSGDIVWYENPGVVGSPWIAHVIGIGNTVNSVLVGDLDNSGTLDIVSLARGGDRAIWHSNTDGTGLAFSSLTVFDGTVNSPIKGILVDTERDSDLDLFVVSNIEGTISYFETLSRNAFYQYPQGRQVDFNTLLRVPTYAELCGTPTMARSGVCVAAAVAATSPCADDTLVLSPGNYSCSQGSHIPVTQTLRVRGAGGGLAGQQTKFDCQGGILFRPDTDGNAVGDLTLESLVVTQTGSGSASPLSVPGLRVNGGGTRLTLINTNITSGSSFSSPSLLGGGEGGCVFVGQGGTLESYHSSFTSCYASGSGGALAISQQATVRLSSTVLEGNTAGGSGGGAISVFPGGSLTLTDNSMLLSNAAPAGVGGGLLVQPVFNDGGNGGSTAAETTVKVIDSVVKGNSARAGGGYAATRDPPGFARAATPSDAPLGIDASFVSPAFGSPIPTLNWVRSTIQDNTAVLYGGGGLVCDVRVQVEGVETRWEGNGVQGSPDARSSADAFVCALDPSLGLDPPFVPDRSNVDAIPWLRFLDGLETRDWELHGPPTRVEWVSEPEAVIEAGAFFRGSVRVVDWFVGQPVVYRDATLRTTVGSALPLAPIVLPDVSMSGPVVDLPATSLGVLPDLVGLVPVNTSVRVEVVSSVSDGSSSLPRAVSVAVTVSPCGPTRGAIQSNAGFITCVSCPENTQGSGATDFEPCVVQNICPRNTARVQSTNTSTDPCVCERGFWIASGRVNEACSPCPVGGECSGGLATPVAAPGYFAEEVGSTLFLACPNAEACRGGESSSCAEGYENRLCGECQAGYYKVGVVECRKCPSTSSLASFVPWWWRF